MGNIEVEQGIRFMAALVKKFPNMLDMAKSNPGFQDIERIAVASVANADSLSEALQAYDDYLGLIPDWKFVIASNRGAVPGLSVNRTFSDGSVVRGLFGTSAVLLLDPTTRQDMESGRKAVIPLDYSISLDSQALSYLAPYLQGKTSRLPDDFHEVFSFISNEHVFVDPIPYMLENLPNVLVQENVEKIKQRLAGYEVLRTMDGPYFHKTGKIQSTVSDVDQQRGINDLLSRMIHDASDPELMETLLNRHASLYATLLKMAMIQLSNPKRSLVSKLDDFMEFLDKTMQTIFAREAVVAAEFFSRGQKLEFFGKIQKSPVARLPELLDALKNMAWDLLHIRHVEGASTIEGAVSELEKPSPRYFFPSLLTCDKKFIEIIDLYPLKSYAYQKSEHKLIPFPSVNWISKIAGSPEREAEFGHRFFSRESVARRDSMRDAALGNMREIARKLETEFAKVAVVK